MVRRVKAWNKLLEDSKVTQNADGELLYSDGGRFNLPMRGWCGKMIELRESKSVFYQYRGPNWSWAEWMLEPVKENGFTELYLKLKCND